MSSSTPHWLENASAADLFNSSSFRDSLHGELLRQKPSTVHGNNPTHEAVNCSSASSFSQRKDSKQDKVLSGCSQGLIHDCLMTNATFALSKHSKSHTQANHENPGSPKAETWENLVNASLQLSPGPGIMDTHVPAKRGSLTAADNRSHKRQNININMLMLPSHSEPPTGL